MLLAIDIGNTNISLGLFNGERLLRRYSIPTQEQRYAGYLRRIFYKHKIDDAIICSVVPESTRMLEKDLTKLLRKKPKIIGRGISIPIRNRYRIPRQVGQDRLVNAYAASFLYGAPLIVVDFGTAVTFDVISKKKEYLGGMILPGLQISLDALAKRTALLPKIKLSKPKEFIGRDTRMSMLSGIVYGFAALTDDLCGKLKAKTGKNSRVVLTGGDIGLIRKFCKQINKVDSTLTLKGLNLIYNNLDSAAHCRRIKQNFH